MRALAVAAVALSSCYSGTCEPSPDTHVRIVEVYQTDSCGAYEQHVRNYNTSLRALLARPDAILNGCDLEVETLSMVSGDETYKRCSYRFTGEDGPAIAKGKCTYEIRQQGGNCVAQVDVIVYSADVP